MISCFVVLYKNLKLCIFITIHIKDMLLNVDTFNTVCVLDFMAYLMKCFCISFDVGGDTISVSNISNRYVRNKF